MKQILLLIISMMLLACYPRTSAVQIQKESTETHTNINELTKSEKQENKVVDIKRSEESSDTKKTEEVESNNSTSDKSEKKETSTSENSSRILKQKTFYPDGQLKSETELTENYSKIQSELAEMITKNQLLSERLQKSIDSSKIVRHENEKLRQELLDESERRYQLELTSEIKSKNKNKNTETDGFPWWGLLLGATITMLCVVVYVKVKSKISILN